MIRRVCTGRMKYRLLNATRTATVEAQLGESAMYVTPAIIAAAEARYGTPREIRAEYEITPAELAMVRVQPARRTRPRCHGLRL